MFEITGKILFDPVNVTRKQHNQSKWKKVAMIVFDCDICGYYSWFIKRRYNIDLNLPIRKPHITFINDSVNDIGDNIEKWGELKSKYDGIEIKLKLNPDVRSDGNHWWLKLDENSTNKLMDIRSEIGLGDPFWSLHMTIGLVNPKHLEHSKYIIESIKKGFILT